MAAVASRQTGRFRIAATPVWKAVVIFPAIAAFREKLLTLRTASFAQGLWLLEKGESDLHCSGVEAGGGLPAFLRRERFLDLTAGIAADEGHPLLEGKPGTTDLATWPCIEFDPPALDILLDRLFRENGKRVTTVLGAGTTRPVPHGGPPLARPAAARTTGPAGRAAAQAYRYPVLQPALPIRLCRPALGRGSDGISSAQADGARNRDRARRKVQRVGRAGLVVRLIEAASLIASDRSHGVELRRFPAAVTAQAADSKRSSKISMIAMSRSPASNWPNDGAPADCGSVGLVASFGDFGHRKLRFPLPVGAPYGSPTGCKPACIIGGRRPIDENLTPSKLGPFERQAHPCHPFP